MSMSDYEVVVTRSGAYAMLDRRAGEIMHPVIGPQAEASALYIEPSRLVRRLDANDAQPLVLFDVGLGAGSNALAALAHSEARTSGSRRLDIVSFDRTEAALRKALLVEHAAAFGLEGPARDAAESLLSIGHWIGTHTRWSLILGDLPTSLEKSKMAADIVFWDPYSPKTNPTLWTVATFHSLRRMCATRATIHTYSAATSTRAAMLLAGLAVGVGRPCGAKEQTTAAAMHPQDLDRALDERWLQRLQRSSAPFPSDAPADAMERIRLATQFL